MRTMSFFPDATKPCLLVLCALFVMASRSGGQSQPAAELLTAAQVRNLTSQQASQALSVKLKGVVTYCDEGLNSRFVQDDTAGIYFSGMKTNMPDLKAGQVIEIEGVTSPGAFAPIIIPRSIRVDGEGNMPDARPGTSQELVSGREDSQFIQVSGIVRAVNFEQSMKQYRLDLMVDGEGLIAYVGQIPETRPEALVDSIVKVQGVCTTVFNQQRQLFAVRMLVPRTTDLIVQQPAPTDPFSSPAQPIRSLLQFTPEGDFGHRVKLSGTVAYAEPGAALFIESGDAGVYCQTQLHERLQPGDQVEVLGFPARGEYSPVLENAIYRKTGHGTVPAPVNLSLTEILSGTNDCRLIQTTARIVACTLHGREQYLVLERDGFTFNAYLGESGKGPGLGALKNGSDALVAGICLIERGSGWRAGGDWRAKSFRLLLRSPADVVVQSRPLLSTQLGIGPAVGVLAAVIFVMLLWVVSLYRRIKAHRVQPA